MIVAFHLLALSKASAFVVYPLMGTCLLLPVYTVLGGWPRTGDRQHVRLLWLLTLPTMAFVGLWLAGATVWSILLWLQWGDAGYSYGKWAAGVIATITSLILFVRMAIGRVSRRYIRLHGWGTGLCAGLFGVMHFIQFAEGIDGWTARGAAENQFAHYMKASDFYPARMQRRIVDETTSDLAAHNGKLYALYMGELRVHEIHVMPYYRWWWSVGYSRNFPYGEGRLSVEEQLRRFEEALKKKRRIVADDP